MTKTLRFLVLVSTLLTALGLVAYCAGAAFAQVVTSTSGPADAGEALTLIGQIATAAKGGAWNIVAGGVLALLVALARFVKILDFIPDQYDKWVVMLLAMMGSTAVGLVGAWDWLTIVITALTAGAAAIGGWELVLKDLRDKIFGRNRV
jgi:phosphoglycerol transferase MdoB-like AlkP superfamily enzyme